jgi:nitrate reductase cytochrome c-type subunit
MTHEERLRFTEKFLAVPENRDKIIHAQMFHESLRRRHAKKQIALPEVSRQGWPQWVTGLFQRPLPAVAFTIVALFLIVVLVALLSLRRRSEQANTIVANAAPTASDNVNPSTNIASNDSVVTGTPTTPQQPPVVPSVNKGPSNADIEIARNEPNRYTQWECLSCQDQRRSERSGSKVVSITLGKKVTSLNFVYELLNDAPDRETYSVTIKNEYNDPIKLKNNKDKEQVKPVFRKRRKFIVINVPTSVFKSSGPYSFEIDDPYISPKIFTIKK